MASADDHIGEHKPNFHIALACVNAAELGIAERIVPQLAHLPNVRLQLIIDYDLLDVYGDLPTDSPTLIVADKPRKPSQRRDWSLEKQTTAEELSRWTDLLIVAPADPELLSKMLHGWTDNLLLDLLRCWDVSKKILMLPSMSSTAWENPMTRKQLSKIRRKWNWIRVGQPVLWHFNGARREVCFREGETELVETVRNQVDLMMIGQDVSYTMGYSTSLKPPSCNAPGLPSEIWSLILDHTRDWELAKALHVYTTLPTPAEWRHPPTTDAATSLMRRLERTILVGTFEDVKKLLESSPTPKWLSRLCVKLIMKFSITRLLSYLESEHKDLFWSTFGHTFVPDKASAVFGNVKILEWWRTSPSFLNKEYTSDAIDLASKNGFVHVLDWWRKSGLPLRYTEIAMEQASSRAHIEVLEWWRNASMHQGGYHVETDSSTKFVMSRPINSRSATPVPQPFSASSSSHQGIVDATPFALPPLRLKVGKSICFAAQNGHVSVIRWFHNSNVPFPYEDTVAKIASSFGHVNVLELWKELKGEKMIFDNQVLVASTKNGYSEVLEWWKNSGLRVEYKTCDIEEALEDSLGGRGEEKVRAWWARNGLNLGVGTSEWMATKLLN